MTPAGRAHRPTACGRPRARGPSAHAATQGGTAGPRRAKPCNTSLRRREGNAAAPILPGAICLLPGITRPHLRAAPSPLSRPAVCRLAPPPQPPPPGPAARPAASPPPRPPLSDRPRAGRQRPPTAARQPPPSPPGAAPGGGAASGPAEGGAGAGPRGGQLPSGRAGAPRPPRREGLRPLSSPGDGRQRGGAG